MKDIVSYILESSDDSMDKIISVLKEYDYVKDKNFDKNTYTQDKNIYTITTSRDGFIIKMNFNNNKNYGIIQQYKDSSRNRKLKLSVISYDTNDEYVEFDKIYKPELISDIDKFIGLALKADSSNQLYGWLQYEK